MLLSAGSSSRWRRHRTTGPDLDERVLELVRERTKGRQTTLKMVLPEGSQENVLPILERFQAGSGVRVELDLTPVDEIGTRLLARHLSGSDPFDLALPATFELAELAESGALLCLDEFAKEHEPEAFCPGSLYSLGDRVDGRLFGYQTDGDTYLMFYDRRRLEDEAERRRYLEETGSELAPARTWAELDRMLAFFHRPQEGLHGGALFRIAGYIAWEWWVRLHGHGVFPVDDDLNPRIDSEEGVLALEELMAASRHLYPEARTNGLFANWRAFAEGNIFCNIGWGGTQKALAKPESKVRDALAFGPTPGGTFDGVPVAMPYFNWGWNYAVGARSRHPELAYLLTLYACSPRVSTIAVRANGFFDPFRPEHYADAAVVERYSAPFLEVHEASMRSSIPDFYLRGHGEYFDVLRRFLVRAETGKMRPREALGLVRRAWDEITDRLGRDRQIAQWRALRASYPQAIRDRLR